jgi:glycosyltransferase involved in cell wall biosynthesis
MDRMKILHVYKDFDPPVMGGMERHIAMMCHFQRQWADVDVLVCSRSWRTRRTVHEGIPITWSCEWGRFQSAPMAPLFPWHLRRMKADVVVVHVPNPTAELAYLLARPSGKLVVRYHSDVVRQASAMKYYMPLFLKFLSKADVIMPTSEAYAKTSVPLQALRSRYPHVDGKGVIRVVPLGIVASEFQHADAGAVNEVRARYGGDFVLFSGVHRYYKGLEFLVRAAPAIHAPVVIAGDGPERERIEALAKELGVRVHFPGALTQADLVAHLHACEVFAFPSIARSEAFGVSMMEAHACGKPIVATRLGTGVEWVNLDGRTGYNVPPCDPAAFAEAVNGLLANPALRREMGMWARARVEQEFNAEHVARKEFSLFQEVMG